LDLVTNVVKINLERKNLNVILYNPLKFDCPQRYFSFKFGKIENIIPTMLSCNNYPGWSFPINDGEIFYTGEITNVCRGDEYVLYLQNLINGYMFPVSSNNSI